MKPTQTVKKHGWALICKCGSVRVFFSKEVAKKDMIKNVRHEDKMFSATIFYKSAPLKDKQ